uniref:LNS2 domain-containing protein n=1 Tax=Heterorhabditis bacteriophora TaxID=37862 RepID=A0A1I7XLB4_HETBA
MHELSRCPMLFSECSCDTYFPSSRISTIACNRIETIALSTPSYSASSFWVCDAFSSNNASKASVFDICSVPKRCWSLTSESPALKRRDQYGQILSILPLLELVENTVEYAVFGGSPYLNCLGTSWCSCNIYLYKWYEKIIISDIDGTITKSDVLGHVIPAIGGTWAHTGVAELYTRIKNNGYKMVYLSSRAIGQSHATKQYLKSIAQDSKQLPDGPVLLSPTSVLLAFRREVIERRPEEFKIAALSDLKKLFPAKQPFFAGFGNRETDVTSYRAVDIQPARILIIDPTGRVRRSDSIGYVSSYLSMAAETVDYLFPPLTRKAEIFDSRRLEKLESTWTKPLEHSAFTHWKPDTDETIVTDGDLLAYETRRKGSMIDKHKK